ncbi:MAG: hypothetical protein KAI43_06220 [Candidatus Aureabacteria bacterium]|nr:hypothetical protein [Candidatus Auribacterota bacterium]
MKRLQIYFFVALLIIFTLGVLSILHASFYGEVIFFSIIPLYFFYKYMEKKLLKNRSESIVYFVLFVVFLLPILLYCVLTPKITPERRARVRTFRQFAYVNYLINENYKKHNKLPNNISEIIEEASDDKLLTDYWGTPLKYNIESLKFLRWQIISAGSDKAFNTDDDIVSHEEIYEK